MEECKHPKEKQIDYHDNSIACEECNSVIEQYGGVDGAHHKDWVLDQVARILTGEGYEAWVKDMKDGEDGPETYSYEEGIAP